MDQVEEVKSKVDIIEVISSYLPLKKAGRNFAGLCPFHSEKTPSFMVSPERQAFKCFGCQEGGDVFTFLQKVEGWEFREALEEMAKRAGVKLANFRPSSGSKIKEKLIEINKLAAKFYKYLLTKHKIGISARDYLKNRGMPPSLWDKFDLGYAPPGFENLTRFMAKKGFDLVDLATAGLIIGREAGSKSYFDRFRNRIMFPLKDSRGTVLGFAGRLINETGREAKYINCPETPIYNKGSLLFGLDVARGAIREKNEVVLVEGEFDVLSCHKAGIFNVVASKGTALTDKQVATLARYSENVVLCFDTDLAGDAAARRGIELLDIAGVNIRVVALGKYKDPDEFARDNPVGFGKAVAQGVNIYDYFINSATGRFDPKDPIGKKKIGNEVMPILAKISDDLVRAHYIAKLAKLLDLSVELVGEAVFKRGLGKLGTDTLVSSEVSSESPDKGRLTTQEYFLALLVSQDEIPHEVLSNVSVDDFESSEAKRFWKYFNDIIKHSRERKISRILKKLPADLSGFVDNLYLVNLGPDFSQKQLWGQEIVKVAKTLRRESLRRKLAQISDKLEEVQAQANGRRMNLLLRQFNKISQNIKKVSV